MDGKLKRVRVDGDKGSEKSGAYVGYIDGYPAGYIENFKTGIKENWKFRLGHESVKIPNEKGLEIVRNESEAKIAQRVDERLILNKKTALRLQNEYDNAATLDGSHPYLNAKGIKPELDNLKIDRFW